MITNHRSKTDALSTLFTWSLTFVFIWVTWSSLKVNACVPNVANSAINHSKPEPLHRQCQCNVTIVARAPSFTPPLDLFALTVMASPSTPTRFSTLNFCLRRSAEGMSQCLLFHKPAEASRSLIFCLNCCSPRRPLLWPGKTADALLQLFPAFLRQRL